ncbi:aspartate/glutamate racemase family protein [Streptomyces prunicolor]|uniref:aspartate/glutamate racemase family protein n=1 Tax=Streptomyces prunicolor TaxID=67348 RepID=UPI00387004DD|nr:aspartate/glutamate racemase family protein [Streptomyces prunicolor]
MTVIAVVNCNTSTTMTETIAAGARAVALPGTHILPLTPAWGVASAEGWFDSFLSAASVLDLLQNLDQPVDGVVMAGFGEHGREGARELLDVPVVDITEAAALYSLVLGRRFAVVTTLARAAGQIEDSLRTAGLLDRCAGVFATGLGVLDLELDPATTEEAFIDASRQAMAAGAEVICLGCAGMTGLDTRMTDRLGIPVVDGVSCAVALVESLAHRRLTTSKGGTYAAPLPKLRTLR